MLRCERLEDRDCPSGLPGFSEEFNSYLAGLGYTNPEVLSADLTGDGWGEVIVWGNAGDGPRVVVFDGKPPAVPLGLGSPNVPGIPPVVYDGMVPGFSLDWRGGLDLTAPGETFIAGQPYRPAKLAVAADAGGGPVVTVYEFRRAGFDTATFFALDREFRGGVNLDAADVDGDGRQELLATPGVGGGPILYVYDPDTGDLLHTVYLSPDHDDRSGLYRVAPAGVAHVNGRLAVLVDRGDTPAGVVDYLTGDPVSDPHPGLN